MKIQAKPLDRKMARPPRPCALPKPLKRIASQEQNRLAEHATQRASFLQSAYDRLTRLLHTARAVEDTGLYNELWQHRVAVRELLEALSHVSSASSVPISFCACFR